MSPKIYLAGIDEIETKFFKGILRRLITYPEWSTKGWQMGTGKVWTGEPKTEWLFWFQSRKFLSPSKADILFATHYLETKDAFFSKLDKAIDIEGLRYPPCKSCGGKFSATRDEFGDIIPWPEEDLCNMCIGIGPR